MYCIISLLTDEVLAHNHSKDWKFFVYGCFTIVEYSFFSIFLLLSLREKIFRYVIIACSVIFYGLAIRNLLTLHTDKFDSLAASSEDILLIIYSIFFLYEQIKDPAVFYVYYVKKFWVVIALLIYFSATLFLFVYASTFATDQQRISNWGINNFFDIIKNLLFSISFVLKKDQQKQYPAENLFVDM